MLRRALLPAILALLCFGSGSIALSTEVGPPSAAAIGAPEPLAPVLTARRVPALLAEPLGRRRLVAALDMVWGAGPQPACVQVVDRQGVLYEQNPDLPLIPASTLKLVTATAVLYHLGPDARLPTVVRAAVPAVDGVVEGDLFLVGGGDPVLGTLPWAASFRRQPALVTPLEVLADRVVASGIREVRGRIVGDERRFDDRRVVPSWPDRYRSQFETGPLSALQVNDGFAVFGRAGAVAFTDPAAGAAQVFTDLLRQRGVVVATDAASGAAPEGPNIALIESPTMAEVVGAMLRESDNGTAELLLKELGLRVAGEGTSEAGARVVTETMRTLGLPMEGVVVVDGSGLDRGNALTCRFLATLLRQAEAGGPLGAGLAVAGISGTLTSRVLGDEPGRIRAKTGSLSEVASLAGYAETRAGSDLVFSYVLNGPACCQGVVLLEDALADALIAFPDVPALDELGPQGAPE